MVLESGEDYVVGELEKTKRKLRDISNSLEMQQQLLRLIVQVNTLIKYFLYFIMLLLYPTIKTLTHQHCTVEWLKIS